MPDPKTIKFSHWIFNGKIFHQTELTPEAYSSAKDKKIHFELCPTSSVSTEAIKLPRGEDGSFSCLA